MFPITSKFGQQELFRGGHSHRGIDFAMPNGTPLRSIREGVVDRVVDFGANINAGKTVFIKWSDGKVAIYGHLSEFAVRKGDVVKVGDLIGYSGNSGNVVGANGGYHLHFGLKGANGQVLDPSPYINDIQNMNNLNFMIEKIPDKVCEITNVKVDFFNFYQSHMNGISDMLSNLKLQIISILPNDVLLIQVFEQLCKFITTHSGTLNYIVTNIL